MIQVHKKNQKDTDTHAINEDNSEEEKDLPPTNIAEINPAWQNKLNEIRT